MRISELFEMVIDASDKFKAKTADNIKKKLDSAVSSLPDRFAQQEKLEKSVADALKELQTNFRNTFSSYRLELAPMLKDFRKNVSIPDALQYCSLPDDEHYPLAVAFVKKHGDKLLAELKRYQEELDAVKNWANEQDWPSGKGSASRYTNLDVVNTEARNCVKAIEKLQKAGKQS